MRHLTRRAVVSGGATASLLPAAAAASGFTVSPGLDDRFVAPATRWLVANFGEVFRTKLQRTPFSLPLLCAFACQESGYVWYKRTVRLSHAPAEILRLLVLDDVAPRRAFPRTSDDFLVDGRFVDLAPTLIAAADVARRAQGQPVTGRVRFGYGLFQYDLQNIVADPAFWRAQASGQTGLWGDLSASTERFLEVLTAKYRTAGGDLDRTVALYNGRGPNAEAYGRIIRRFETIAATAV